MARHKNGDWNIPDGDELRWEHVPIAVLMDIRDELQKLNRLLYCNNFTRIPYKLDQIEENTRKPKRKKRKKKIA